MKDNKFAAFTVGIAALAIAGCAAYFSVIGISKLFGGSPTATMIMGGVLEFGKLVCASLAYRFWVNDVSRVTSMIFVIMTAVMMFVTSIGIFGFLSNSYQQVANKLSMSEQKIENLEKRQSLFQERMTRYDQEREILLDDKQTLRQDVSRANEQYAERGWRTDQQQVQRLQSQIQNVNSQLKSINEDIATANDSVAVIDQRILNINSDDSGVRAKLGPIMQTADLFGIDRDRSALIFIGIIMTVFDPMAVALVIGFNMMTGRHSDEREEDIPTPTSKKESDTEQSEASEDKSQLEILNSVAPTTQKPRSSHKKKSDRSKLKEFLERVPRNKKTHSKNTPPNDDDEDDEEEVQIEDDLSVEDPTIIDEEDVDEPGALTDLDNIETGVEKFAYSAYSGLGPDFLAELEHLENASTGQPIFREDTKEITKQDINSFKQKLKDRNKKYVISKNGGISVQYVND